MKKYKSNYLVTVMFQLCNIFLSLFPGVFLMSEILAKDDEFNVWFLFLMYSFFILFFIIVGNILHFIVSLFTKHKVFIDDKSITIKGDKILTQKIEFKDVILIMFDHGMITRYGRGTPCSLNIYTTDYKNSMCIENPSFFMTLHIIVKCKRVKFKFNNYKEYIIYCAIFTIITLILCIFS